MPLYPSTREVDSLLDEARAKLPSPGSQEDHRERDLILAKLDQMLVDLEYARETDDSSQLRQVTDDLRRRINHVRYVK